MESIESDLGSPLEVVPADVHSTCRFFTKVILLKSVSKRSVSFQVNAPAIASLLSSSGVKLVVALVLGKLEAFLSHAMVLHGSIFPVAALTSVGEMEGDDVDEDAKTSAPNEDEEEGECARTSAVMVVL